MIVPALTMLTAICMSAVQIMSVEFGMAVITNVARIVAVSASHEVRS